MMLAIIKLCTLVHDEQQATVAVHCREGKGRTGTVCAAYLLYRYQHLTVAEAIGLIRTRSPLSIESRKQEDFVEHFASFCRLALHHRGKDEVKLT